MTEPLPGEPSALVVRRLAVANLQADPRNAMTHPEASISAIESSLREFGQQKPIVVDQTGMIVAGHGTVEAAKRLGWTHVEAALSTLEGARRAGFAIADNRTAQLAKWHDEQLAETIRGIEAAGIAPKDVGFDAAALEKLMRSLGEASPAPDQSETARVGYAVLIDCKSDAEQLEIIERCQAEGWTCKALV